VIYTLDTNVLIDALRQPAELDRLKAFLSWALPSTVLSSVVVAELILGARLPKAREALEQQFLAPFERRGRILAPSAAAWQRAATILTARGGAPSANHLSDALLACQTREFGWTLVTRDADFAALRRSITGLKTVAPFPARP
jgi:predicted nucleic acid-binding protein